jgi:hypothetical protein
MVTYNFTGEDSGTSLDIKKSSSSSLKLTIHNDKEKSVRLDAMSIKELRDILDIVLKQIERDR